MIVWARHGTGADRTRMVAEGPDPGQRPGPSHRLACRIGRLVASVIAIVGGLATAVLWATTLLGSARSAPADRAPGRRSAG